MTRYVFEKVERRGSKRVPCSECGKKLVRSKTFTQTINPWNAHPDGTPRTRSEIWEALGIKVAEWRREPEHCAAHEGVRQYGSVDVGCGT